MKTRNLPRILLALPCLLMSGFSLHAESIVWTNTAGDWHRGENWNLLRPPATGDDVVIADGADILLTNATPLLQSFTQTGGRLTFSNWTTRLQAVTVRLDAGTLTHTGPSGVDEMSNRVWIACTDFTLGTNASISVDARGYKAAQGPGAGGSSSGGGGGGHGGIGGLPYGKSPLARGAANGDARFPGSPGSGGGLAVGGAGGGVVRIDCTGQATLFGTIQAAGGKAGQDAGGGSGGSIWLSCQGLSIHSDGLLSAPGGAGQDTGAGGGGGRIAIHYQTPPASIPPLRLSTDGGVKGGRSTQGQVGTLYLSDAALLPTTLGASPISYTRLVLGVPSWTVSSLAAPASTIGFSGDGFRLHVEGDLSVNGSSSQLSFGDDVSTGMVLHVGGNLIVTNGATLQFASGATNGVAPFGCRVQVGGDILVGPALSRLIVVSHEINGGSVGFQARNLVVAETGVVTADLAGWQPDCGPGRGIKVGNSGGAGGYGGNGGAGGYGGAGGGTYPHPFRPTLPGSGGSLSGNYGGGALLFALAGHARVDGTLSANGGQALGYYGAGSGGSIFLQCRRFSGSATGLLTASGGNGDTRGGGGGGGRIAVLLGLSDTEADALLQEPPPRHLIITTNHVRFAGGINVSGGGPGSDKGGAGQPGTVFFVQPIHGTLLSIR